MERRIHHAALALLALGAPACQLIIGLQSSDKVDAVGGDADAADAAPPVEAAVDSGLFDPCGASTVFPPSPRSTGPAQASLRFALRFPEFRGSAAGAHATCADPAYDLDGRDVNGGGAGAASTCVRGTSNTTDLEEGRDNGLGLLLGKLTTVFVPLEERIEKGSLDLVIQISGYDQGGPSDQANVRVDIFRVGPIADGGLAWDGNDNWFVDSSDCLDPTDCTASKTTTTGWIVGRVLFARFSSVAIPVQLGGDRVDLPLTNVILTGEIVPNEIAPFVRGRLAGKMAVGPGLAAIGRAKSNGVPLCETGEWDSFYRQPVCQYADLPAGAPDPDPGVGCGALSFAIGFEGWKTNKGTPRMFDAGAECHDASAFRCDP